MLCLEKPRSARNADGFESWRYSLNYKHFLGYDKGEDGRLVVNPAQATIVRRIFGDFLAGLTPFQIAKALTAEGIPTPAGKTQWSYTTVRRVLSKLRVVDLIQ